METYNPATQSYAFSNEWIESTPYLNRDEKELMKALVNYPKWNTNNTNTSSTKNTKTMRITEDLRGRRTLERKEYPTSIKIDFNKKRWYETDRQFIEREIKNSRKGVTTKVKEVTRENVFVERSTFEDGTQVTAWDKTTRYYV